ncbi:hypothetical protein [Psychrobacillus phage Perkons]|nr:hypothetical protein [Psychrobacillus phage Perkons]
MTIQTKEIGVSLGVDKGTFHNTNFTTGKLQLNKVGETEDLKPLYATNGYWESEVIDLVDKFKEYDKIVLSKTQFTQDFYEVLTRTSDDNSTFSEYKVVAMDGKVQSPTKRYIQIKINFEAGMISQEFLISNFNNVTDIQAWSNADLVETKDGVLKLKRDYVFPMAKDVTWSSEGSLHRKKIARNEWKKINTLGVE